MGNSTGLSRRGIRSVPDGEGGRLGATVHAKLGQQRGHIVLGGLFRQEHVLGAIWRLVSPWPIQLEHCAFPARLEPTAGSSPARWSCRRSVGPAWARSGRASAARARPSARHPRGRLQMSASPRSRGTRHDLPLGGPAGLGRPGQATDRRRGSWTSSACSARIRRSFSCTSMTTGPRSGACGVEPLRVEPLRVEPLRVDEGVRLAGAVCRPFLGERELLEVAADRL